MTDPCRTILGVTSAEGPFAVLGLTPGIYPATQIEAALHRRLAEIFEHPAGRTEEAADVRQAVRTAAEALHGAAGQRRELDRLGLTPPAVERGPRLTEFDRQALAVLVGSGGWNAQSRARLVGLAETHGVTARGLLTVIHGLNDHARRRGTRLGIEEIATFRRDVPPRGAPPSRAAEAVGRALGDHAAEPDEDHVWSRIRMSVIFGALTVALGIVMVKLMLPANEPRPEIAPAPPPSDGAFVARPAPSPEEAAVSDVGPLVFRHPPTFLGEGRPEDATNAADRTAELLKRLDLISRKLIVSDDPAEAVYRDWDDVVETAAIGWVMVSGSGRRSLDEAILEVLFAASPTPSVSDRLLSSFVPVRDRPRRPLDIWRDAWKTGTLATVARATALPPSVVDGARSRVRVALADVEVGTAPDFNAAAAAWLESVANHLVEAFDVDPDVYDHWELWLGAQTRLGDESRRERAVIRAVASIMRTGADLSRPGPAVNVLGRLLSALDFERSPTVRDGILALFEDERISSHSLWVVTSMLARYDTAPWLEPGLVLAPDADWRHRRRVRDLIGRAWPEPASDPAETEGAGRGIVVDAALGRRWHALQDEVRKQSLDTDPIAMMRRLLAASRLNEAAAILAAQRVSQAESVLDEVERLLGSAGGPGGPRGGASPPRRRGQAIGTDGEWAAAFREAGRDKDERLELLADLRGRAGTDLGPLDADVFVGAVYRGMPQAVREVAAAMLVDLFSAGPNVVLEMLDQFPGAPAGAPTSETVGQLTGALLPAATAPTWRDQARAALLRHALSLRRLETDDVDVWLAPLTDSLVARAEAVRAERSGLLPPAAPAEAGLILVEAWQSRAAILLMNEPVPDDLPALERRLAGRLALALGPIQRFVAVEVSILEHAAYVMVAEQPQRRELVLALLAAASERRAEEPDVLRQALDGEICIGAVWRMRLQVEDAAERGS